MDNITTPCTPTKEKTQTNLDFSSVVLAGPLHTDFSVSSDSLDDFDVSVLDEQGSKEKQ